MGGGFFLPTIVLRGSAYLPKHILFKPHPLQRKDWSTQLPTSVWKG